MRVVIRYEYGDFSHTQRGKWPRQPQPRVFWLALGALAVSTLLLAAGSVYLSMKVSPLWAVLLVAPAAQTTAVLLAAFRWGRKNDAGSARNWSRSPLSTQPAVVELDGDGFRFLTERERHFVPWRSVRKIYENENGWWVETRSTSYRVPRRVFQTHDEARDFAWLLAAGHGRPLITPVAPPVRPAPTPNSRN